MKAADRRAPAAAGRCLAAGALAAFLIGACGLPSSSNLERPRDCEGDDVPGVMTFCGSVSGVSFSFQGYEIYYKLITSAEATPQPRHHNDLRARFGRLSRAASRSCDGDRPPLVAAAGAGTDHRVSFDVRGLGAGQDAADEPFLELSWPPPEEGRIGVRRGIQDDGDPLRACRRFAEIDGYRTGHRDLSAAAAAALTGRTGTLIEIVAYAVSYGRDRGETFYSAPLAIGREQLDLY